ncbi:flagellar basal body-associated protein FliL [Altererythrobacter sp. Root672]|uniref:flagellar basal body-associated FliL family protein n=1 Tax=Altererythrobacter sp. Root672 TaxID=1736584 RepID=UPI0006F57E4B|nr:flagellar basal body-associated FliL family protein [Altererythrobacter sp. Root672]KRA82846.1 flagellar basal body-associated protein FliL [Altererythrobacter sp. Root672]
MSSKKTSEEKPKKGKGMILMIGLGIVLIAAGGGGAFALVQTGVIGGAHGEEDNKPKLVRKGDEDPYAPAPAKGEEGGAELVYGDGGSKYRTAYYRFPEEFTSNLRNSDGLVQLSLAASTRYDGRVLMWLGEHQLAIRSRLLVEIANASAEEVETPQGKAALQKRLTAAINDVLLKAEGFGGVDNVHFLTFIVQ